MSVLGPNGSTHIEIHVQSKALGSGSASQLVRDKFLVSCTTVEKEGLNHTQITEIMKVSSNGDFPSRDVRNSDRNENALGFFGFGSSKIPLNGVSATIFLAKKRTCNSTTPSEKQLMK